MAHCFFSENSFYLQSSYRLALAIPTIRQSMSIFHAPTRFSRCFLAFATAFVLQACGGSDSGTNSPPSSTGKIALLAGDVGGLGNLDGPRDSATFYAINSLAVDPAGNLMVAEIGNHALRKISPEGLVSTVAGGDMVSAYADGQGSVAKFLNPQFVAADQGGNWYVSDNGDYIRKVTPAGVVSTLANVAADVGCPATCLKHKPLTVDPAGTVYFIANNKLRKLGANGQAVTVVDAISSKGIGTPAFTILYLPSSLVADTKGNIFIADRNEPVIRKVTPSGEMSVVAGGSMSASPGVDGLGSSASFSVLQAITRDASDNLYVWEANGAIRKITPEGSVSTVGQSQEQWNSGWGYKFVGFARDADGNYFVSAQGSSANAPVLGNPAILKIDPQGVQSAYAGAQGQVGDADGAGNVARFSDPRSPTIDPGGNVFVLDSIWDANTHLANHRVESRYLRRIAPSGNTTAIARISNYEDGMAGAAVDRQGNTYVGGDRRIRIVAADGSVKSFVEADRSLPDGFKVLALDSEGSVYAAAGSKEPAPNTPIYWPVRPYGAIYKVSANKTITLLAGKAGAQGHVNGMGEFARFSSIGGGTVDSGGNVYVADTANHVIRKITPAGVVSTLAGQPGVGGYGDGALAQAKFWMPVDVKADDQGNLYVADRNNSVVRKITANGTVSTVVGTPGKYGFVAGALPGVIPPPEGLAVVGSVLYITTRNGVLRVDL